MNPGPEAVSIARLKGYTWAAAKFLFLLRDGREGRFFKTNVLDPDLQKAVLIVPVNLSRAEIDAIWRKKFEPLNKDNEFYSIEKPVYPAAELWTALKRARSEPEISNVADQIAEWDRLEGLGYTPASSSSQAEYNFPAALRVHARTILDAKRLPEFPRSERAKSDDKRIWFFAKVLAGLMLGQSPLYTLKRLSRWHGEPYPELKGAKR